MEVWSKVRRIILDVTCNSIWQCLHDLDFIRRMTMVHRVFNHHVEGHKCLIGMFCLAPLFFFYKFRELWGKLMLMLSLHSHGFWYGKFFLVKSCIDVLRHLQARGPLLLLHNGIYSKHGTGSMG
jgi:hypothetical protein